MKARNVVLLILAIIVADQALKFYIKLNFFASEEHKIIGNWFRLHFVENEGMAYGWQFGSGFGKIALTLFRLVAVVWGSFLLRDFIRKKYTTGFIVCAALIYAGALGNLIDSMFYGLIFDNSDFFRMNVAHLFPHGGGYAKFLHGRVVDMLYFPIVQSHYPSWVPIVGGQEFEFFSFVFNIADASISIGVIVLLLFQNKFLKHEKQAEPIPATTEIIQESKEEIN
ncbi:MAG: lipoprotein signal peptidase [Bacteroidota bacterium]|nr:lipoprotein signal peptidase [Bacteroidota bacterium]